MTPVFSVTTSISLNVSVEMPNGDIYGARGDASADGITSMVASIENYALQHDNPINEVDLDRLRGLLEDQI